MAAGLPPSQPSPSDVTLTVSRPVFDQLKTMVGLLHAALNAADAQVKANDKVAMNPVLTGAGAASPPAADPLAGFGAELNQASSQGLGQ